MTGNSKRIKVAVLHFQPLERYPPVMNDIRDFKTMPNSKLSVFSTSNHDNWFNEEGVKIYRYGKPSTQNRFIRYSIYVFFNLLVCIKLLLLRPSHIIAYETLSVFPAFVIHKIYPDTKIHIHLHEYTSKEEIDASSKYYKWLIKLERKIISQKYCWVSHTNKDRNRLYLKDNPEIDEKKMLVFPNYPPASWYENAVKNKSLKINSSHIKLVHVGALSLDTTYLLEMVDWVISKNGVYHLDFYLSNIDQKTVNYLDNIVATYEFIKIYPTVKYYELPDILKNYDIGLVLYKGCIPNYVYNVPNKVLEYLACGLDVWYSDKLKSTKIFVEANGIDRCYELNFLDLSKFPVTLDVSINENKFFEDFINLENKINFVIQKS